MRAQIFEPIKDSTIESVSIILLEVLNPDVGQPTDVHLEDLKRESEREQQSVMMKLRIE